MMILWIWIPNTGKKYGDPYPTTQKHGIDRQQVVQGKGQWDGSDGCEEYMMVLVAGIVVVGEGKGWVWWWVGKRRMGECGGGWGRGEWMNRVERSFYFRGGFTLKNLIKFHVYDTFLLSRLFQHRRYPSCQQNSFASVAQRRENVACLPISGFWILIQNSNIWLNMSSMG